jgi:nitrite reductase/ring-hydroxylating ferredoxin subunit
MTPPLELPFPSGWFCVAVAADVPPGAVQTITFMGEERVLFRTASGTLGLVDAYCPHLGAHLGHGGRVEGETLRCPFHGFRFGPGGACAASYGGQAPARIRARTLPVREKHGLVLAWYHPEGRAPDWEVPDVDLAGFSPFLFHRFSLRGHPQETTENSVDTGHFGAVHGFAAVETLHTGTDGPRLTADYRFSRFVGKGRLGFTQQVLIHVDVWGLGYSLVDVHVPALGLRTRQLVLPTPTSMDHLDLRIAIAAHDARSLRWVGPLLPGFVTGLIARAVLSVYKDDVAQDFAIWENKRYVARPILARGDGPIMRYRRWAAQFYPAPSERHAGAPRVDGRATARPDPG